MTECLPDPFDWGRVQAKETLTSNPLVILYKQGVQLIYKIDYNIGNLPVWHPILYLDY